MSVTRSVSFDPDFDSDSDPLTKTSHEATLVAKLRSRIYDVLQEDATFADEFYLLYWLKSRKMKLDAAENGIRSSFKWRRENGLKHSTMEELPKETVEMLPMHGNSVDKNGVPVMQLATGRWDVKQFIELNGRDGFVHTMAQSLMNGEKIFIDYNRQLEKEAQNSKIMEMANQNHQSQSQGRGVTMVINCADYTFKQFSYWPGTTAAIESVQLYERHFPKYVDKFIFINVNKIAMIVTKMVLPFLGVPDVELYGCDSNIWRPKLLDRIEADQLLIHFGGCKILSEA